ncbi:MAG: S-methyl-5-thioribose-1-phosphate isomerase [Candidatus Sumerlaeaceae bacterium]
MPEKTVWGEDGKVYLLDQTLLPGEKHVLEISTPEQMWEAIKTLRVRGAPAIGIAAAYGIYIASRQAADAKDGRSPMEIVNGAADYLATSRPTAVNLFWALERVRNAAGEREAASHEQLAGFLLSLANLMRDEDDQACLAIGKHGASLLQSGDCVLTHCNAGGLATATYGTALAPVYYAVLQEQKQVQVYADETRPLLQGSRLTAWELMQAGIPVTLICDNMAASVMRSGRITSVIVGADRIAANGDFANKIGTYGVAVLAREHKLPLYVAAPLSTFDVSLASGDQIPIEERDPSEVRMLNGQAIAPLDVQVYNPAFDVTPARLVTAFITERGILRPPFEQAISALFSASATL